jgi:hypothetical protein
MDRERDCARTDNVPAPEPVVNATVGTVPLRARNDRRWLWDPDAEREAPLPPGGAGGRGSKRGVKHADHQRLRRDRQRGAGGGLEHTHEIVSDCRI